MVSIITTILNEEDNISDFLNSILNQTISPDEVIIVDGGSKDGTWSYLQEKAKKSY